jgi:Short C-terminal domain
MPGLLRGVARTAVIAGTATAVSNRVSRRQAGRWAEQEQAQAYQQQTYQQEQPASATPTDDMNSKLTQLKELGQLREQGVLTDAEFEAQKSAILNT